MQTGHSSKEASLSVIDILWLENKTDETVQNGLTEKIVETVNTVQLKMRKPRLKEFSKS